MREWGWSRATGDFKKNSLPMVGGSSVLPVLGYSRMRVILFFAWMCPDCSLISRFVVFNARAMRQV